MGNHDVGRGIAAWAMPAPSMQIKPHDTIIILFLVKLLLLGGLAGSLAVL